MSHIDRLFDASYVAEMWETWCGETPWSTWMLRWADLGGKVEWWCGYPRSKSAIPLCFGLVGADGKRLEGSSRLKDIRAAVIFYRGK